MSTEKQSGGRAGAMRAKDATVCFGCGGWIRSERIETLWTCTRGDINILIEGYPRREQAWRKTREEIYDSTKFGLKRQTKRHIAFCSLHMRLWYF